MLTYMALFPNGKKYIGCTTQTLRKRMLDHYCAHTRVDNKFYRACLKYGFNNLEFWLIAEHRSKEAMFEAEKTLIARHKTQQDAYGYNTTAGGEGCNGLVYTEQMRLNISIAQKKRFECPIARKETSKKMKEWNIKNPLKAKEYINKRIETNRKEEYRKRASEKQLQFIKQNPDYCKNFGKMVSKRYEENPSLREQISRSLGGKPILVFKTNKLVHRFITLAECCKKLNLNQGNVRSALKGLRGRKFVKGYTFLKEE